MTKKVDRKPALVAFAYANQLVGHLREADVMYDSAAKSSPGDFEIRKRAIEFKFKQGRVKEAESWLREFLASSEAAKSPQNRAWARRTLALSLAASRTYAKHVEAEGLIDKNLEEFPTDTDRVTLAMIDASFSMRAAQERALELLTKLDARRGVLTPDNRTVLAMLLSGRDWVKSSRILREVVTTSKDPRHMAAYVEALLNHSELAEADVWLRRMEELAPDDFATADLRARWLARKNSYQEAFDRIVTALGKEGNKTPARVGLRRAASARLEELGNELTHLKRQDEARRFFTQAEALLSGADGRAGSASVDHLQFLVRRGRHADALEEFDRLCEHASAVEVDQACLSCASLRTDDRQLLNRLERSIARLTQQRPTASIWVALAAIQEQLEQYDEVEASYERALALDGTRVDALNNLACILALRKKDLTKARSLVDNAIAQAGPRGALLDSRALVELAAGQSAAALADTENAVNEDPSAIHLFHQARARLSNGNKEKARDSFQSATAHGLTPAAVPPLEVAIFQELKSQLEPARL